MIRKTGIPARCGSGQAVRNLPHRMLHLGGSLPLMLVVLALAGACDESAVGPEGAMMRIGGDLFQAGGQLLMSDSLAGDVIAVGGVTEFDGMSGGDYIGAGGEIALRGNIGGSVRAAGGRIMLHSNVTRNVTVAGGNVELASDGTVGGNAYVAGGSVVVRSPVLGTLNVVGGEVTLHGTVGGDVRVEAGKLNIGPDAAIAGTLRYRVKDSAVSIDPAATIGGETIVMPPREDVKFPIFAFRVFSGLGFVLAGCVLVLLFPVTLRFGADTLAKRPGGSLGIGAAWVFSLPVAILLAAVTLVGLPAAMITGTIYLAALYLARVVAGLWLGRLILKQEGAKSPGATMLAFVVGGIAIYLAGLVPIIGFLVTVAATLLGVGAFFLGLKPAREEIWASAA